MAAPTTPSGASPPPSQDPIWKPGTFNLGVSGNVVSRCFVLFSCMGLPFVYVCVLDLWML